jgi:hypothetical protein
MVATKNSVVEVEVCGPAGRQLFFRPIGRALRGRLSFADARTTSQFEQQRRWPEPVPGLVLGVNLATGEKYLRDPIHDPEHRAVQQRIAKYGFQLPPERETFESESLATWIFWLHKAVTAGLARVIKGELPPLDTLEGEPRRHFITAPPRSPNAGMVEAFSALAKAIEANTHVMTAVLDRLEKR